VKNLAFSDPVCERAREYASLRLDGELSELEEALLAAHLSRCEPCKSFDADIRMLTSELRQAAFERPSEPIVALFAGAVETVLKPRTATSATPAAKMLIAPGSEVRELRALNRVRLETGIRISPTLLRALRLPGDS
jgi:anti-sigma factor RsiW